MQPRARTVTAVASPALAAEEVIARITDAEIPIGETSNKVDLFALVDITMDATATDLTLSIRRGDILGTVIGTFGPAAITGGARVVQPVMATDTEHDLGYVLTATCTAATGASTVNGIFMLAMW